MVSLGCRVPRGSRATVDRTRRVETSSAGRRLEDGQPAGALVDGDAGGNRECRLTRRVPLTAEKHPSGCRLNGQPSLTVRTPPHPIESVPDRILERVTPWVETEVEGFAPLDPDLREATVVTRRVGDARTGRKSPPAFTVETHHVTARADERTGVYWTGTDGEPGFGDRQVAGGCCGLGDDTEPTRAVSGGDGEAVGV